MGEAFHAVSPAALTLRGYAYPIFPPWDEWKDTATSGDAALSCDHMAHSPCGSAEKARRMLGYLSRHTSLQAVREAVDWMVAHGWIKLDG